VNKCVQNNGEVSLTGESQSNLKKPIKGHFVTNLICLKRFVSFIQYSVMSGEYYSRAISSISKRLSYVLKIIK